MSLNDWWARQTRFTDAQAAHWETTRQRGRRRYILIQGVLIFGVGGVILGALVRHLSTEEGMDWGRMAIKVALLPLAGFWFGRRMWAHHERRYEVWRAGRGRTDRVGHA